jgi:uncharacterized protein with HEPN domain
VRDPRERLLDVVHAIDEIERYAKGGRAAFDADELVRTWIVHHLEIIGEAARGIAPQTRALAPDVPWAAIVAMRNILVHGYFEIDADVVWQVVTRDLPGLRRGVENLLRRLP